MNDRVSRYYDENTSRFLRLGGSGETAAIHRQVWGPGVQDRAHSFTYTNELIKERFTRLLPASRTGTCLLDLGCGVGGTATWLVQEMGAKVVGISNSTVQVRLAKQRAEKMGIADQCRFYFGDFHLLDRLETLLYTRTPPQQGGFDGEYAIESFTHSTDPARFFQVATKNLKPAGLLVLVDDFLAGIHHPPDAFPWLRCFQDGWHLNSLLMIQEVVDLAGCAGLRLIEQEDLTAYLRPLPGLRLALMKWITRIPKQSTYLQNLSGGAALQVCIQKGWTTYNILTFICGQAPS